MKIFLAGATGAIGRPLIARLLAMGHRVIGMTSSERGLGILGEIGAQGVVANALNAQSVRTVMEKFGPDAVIEELTSLPRHYTPEEMRAAAERDRQVRLQGGGNVYHAAREVGARRYIVQSTGFFYAPGPGLEATDDGDIADQVRERRYPITGLGQGVWSWVHVEDAAAATAAALVCPPGVYTIVDDDPSPLSVWLPAFAAALGAPTRHASPNKTHFEAPVLIRCITPHSYEALPTPRQNGN